MAELEILLPNGQVLACLTYIKDPILGIIPWDGSGGGGGGGAVTIADGADIAEGAKADAEWDGVSAAASVIAILKRIALSSSSSVSIADGADVTLGAIADTAITDDSPGTVNAHIRGLVALFSGVNGGNVILVDGVGHQLAIDASGRITVLGPLTDAQLRATPVPISGSISFTAPQHTIIDSGSTVVTQPTGTNLHVTVDNTQAVTNDGTFATPAKQDTGNTSLASAVTTLNAILANQIVPLGGPQAIAQNAYWVNHRLDEQNLIQNMIQNVNSMIGQESENSQRMGYELR